MKVKINMFLQIEITAETVLEAVALNSLLPCPDRCPYCEEEIQPVVVANTLEITKQMVAATL